MQSAYLFEKEKDGFHGFDGDMNILFFLFLLTTVSIIYIICIITIVIVLAAVKISRMFKYSYPREIRLFRLPV